MNDGYNLRVGGDGAYMETPEGDVVMRVRKDGYYVDIETFPVEGATLTLAEFARLAKWVSQ